MTKEPVTLEIEKYRTDPAKRQWDLPPWGHPIGQGIMPLLISYDGNLYPVGTAFTVGDGVTFIASAAHNIREALKHEGRLTHLLAAKDLPEKLDLKQVGFYVLHHRQTHEGGGPLTLLPLETVDGAPPTDVIFGYPQFQVGLPTLVHTLSFDLPPIGEKVWSIGYCDFIPNQPIPLAAVRDGSFDWSRDYRHRLVVVEGFVERIFTQRFASGFVEGACFVFDADIEHAQSGGPVMSTDGLIRGINSAGASMFFGRPASIASLLYPFLFLQMRFGLQMGPVRLNGSQPMISLIEHGTIVTDGSEQRLGIRYDDEIGRYSVNPVAPKAMSPFIHDDFAGFQAGLTATRETRSGFRLRMVERQENLLDVIGTAESAGA